jgi:hypothetical protein
MTFWFHGISFRLIAVLGGKIVGGLKSPALGKNGGITEPKWRFRIEDSGRNGQAQNIPEARFTAEGARRYHAIHKKDARSAPEARKSVKVTPLLLLKP